MAAVAKILLQKAITLFFKMENKKRNVEVSAFTRI